MERSLGSAWLGFVPSTSIFTETRIGRTSSISGIAPKCTCGGAGVRRDATMLRQLQRSDGPPWLPTAMLAQSLAADPATDGNEQDSMADELWWEEGTAVQSLEMACRLANGDELDPWHLSELLMDVGAMSVTVDDSNVGTMEEVPLFHDDGKPKAFDPTIPLPSVSGRKDMWGAGSRVVALFPRQWDMKGIVNTVEEACKMIIEFGDGCFESRVTRLLSTSVAVLELVSPLVFKVDDVVDKDWVKTVQEGWDPIEVGNLRIRFPWHPPLPPSEKRPGQVELELEGGRAFGTGEHPTTYMCCNWVQENAEGQRVLDYGSGSGILGLAALSFGATEAVGVELDLSAIVSAATNAATNGLKMDTYYPQEVGIAEGIDLVLTKLAVSEDGSGKPPGDSKELLPVADGIAISSEELGKFDMTVANILAAPITRLQPVFAYFTRPGGKLALSGVLEEQADAVLAAYAANFDLAVTERLGGWVLLSVSQAGETCPHALFSDLDVMGPVREIVCRAWRSPKHVFDAPQLRRDAQRREMMSTASDALA